MVVKRGASRLANIVHSTIFSDFFSMKKSFCKALQNVNSGHLRIAIDIAIDKQQSLHTTVCLDDSMKSFK